MPQRRRPQGSKQGGGALTYDPALSRKGPLFGSFAGGDANSRSRHVVDVTFGGTGSTINVTDNIEGIASLLSDADASGTGGGFGGFASSVSVGTNAGATGTVNFNVGNTNHVEAGNLIQLIAEQGGEGSDISDGTIVNSNAGSNTINFGKSHKLIDGNTITYSGTTYGGVVNGKEYSVVVVNDNEIRLGSKFGSGQVSSVQDTITIPGHTFSDGTITPYDEVIYNSNGGTPIGGLSNGTKYQVRVIDENTIKLQTIGWSETQVDVSRTQIGAGDNIISANNSFSNGDAVTYRGPEPAEFSSVTVDGTLTSTDPFSFSYNDNDRIYAPDHDFVTGERVRYTRSASGVSPVTLSGLSNNGVYYVNVVNGNYIRLSTDFYKATGTDDPGTGGTDETGVFEFIDIEENTGTNASKTVHKLTSLDNPKVLTEGGVYFVGSGGGASFELYYDAALNNPVNFNVSGTGGSHRFVKEGINLTSTGPSSGQTLVFDLTANNISGTFDGVGGAAGFQLPSSADGIVNSSAGGSGGSLGWSNATGQTYAAQVASTNFDVAANAHLSAKDIVITTDGDANAVANADGGGGGAISIGDAQAYATVVNTSLINIGQNADINALNNVTISGILKSYSSSEGQTTSGSFLGAGADGKAVSRLYYGVDQMINGDITAGNALIITNSVDNNAVAKAEAYGGGVFGVSTNVNATAEVRRANQIDASNGFWGDHRITLLRDEAAGGSTANKINAYYDAFRGAEITVLGSADLLGETVQINSELARNRANTNTNTTAGAAGGSAVSRSTSNIVGENRVVLNNGAEVTGNTSILVQAKNNQTDNYAKAKARLYAIGGSTTADATIGVDNDVKIEGHWESILRTADLDVNAIDQNISNNRSRSAGGAYIGPSHRGGSDTISLTRHIFWEAHVILLGEPNPYLHIDKDGYIRSLSNIAFLGTNAGKQINERLSLANKQVILDDIIFDQAGEATFYANADSTYGSQGVIWGNEGLIESQRSWDHVTIINESDWDLVINHIDAIDGGAVVKVQVDDIKYDGAGAAGNTSNTAGTVGNTFEFRLNLFYPQTEVRILNMDHALTDFDFYTGPSFSGTALNEPTSDIILLGGIENTFGHTTIINERGDIRVDERDQVVQDTLLPDAIFDEGLIRTNTITVDASGDIGNQNAAVTGTDARARKAMSVELMRINHAVQNEDPVELKEVSLVATAGDDAVLDITLHDRTTDGTSALSVEIEKVTAGDDVDLVINDSKAGNAVSTLNGVTVQTYNPPNLTNTVARTGSYFRYWSPDADGGASYYDFLARTLGTTSTEVDSTYTFAEVRAGDDIDIGHLTTNQNYIGAENRNYRTTAISYGAMDPMTKVTPITLSSDVPDTTINFVVYGDVDWTGGTVQATEVEQIFLTTNGYIHASELIGDMLVGHIHSTADDVVLRSGGRIFDADGLATVDVTGNNITLLSGVTTGGGTTAGGLTIPTGTTSPSAGGIGTQTANGSQSSFLEINVDRNNAGGTLNAFDVNATDTHTGIYIDELTGDLRVSLVQTVENVSLRTVAGSIVDADDDTTADVIGQTIDLDANGFGASIGQLGNDLEIDSNIGNSEVDFADEAARDAALNNTLLDDVSLEASSNIFLSETDGALRLALAHAFYGVIRLTVRETSDTDEHLYLQDHGSARFAESNLRNPGFQQDSLRTFAHGTIFAETGSVTLIVGDNIAFDANADVLANGDITIRGDANATDGAISVADPDVTWGTNMILRGRIIANADVMTPGIDGYTGTGNPALGQAVATYTAPGSVMTRIFGNDDVDMIQFGDAGGVAGGAVQGNAGYIYLGSKTRVYGSADLPGAGGQNGKNLTLGNDGEDMFRVFYLQDTATVTSPSMLSNPNDSDPAYGPDLTDLGRQFAEHTLTLDGQADTDTYEVYVLGSNGTDTRNYIINVLDSGHENDGVDELFVLSPAGDDGTDDIFLLRGMQDIDNENVDRPGFVSLLHGTVSTDQDVVQFNEDSAEIQRIQYDTGINGRLTVEGREGDDQFYSDDTTVITTLDGGAGDDTFQVGQIFGMNRTLDANMLPNDVFPELVATTRGWLSPGSSSPLLAQGGSGNDTFRVYSNQAELRLEGDDDNDLFIVRAFALAATTDFDWNGDGVINKADLEAGLAVQIAANNDLNGDGGINFLDVYKTLNDITDDVIVLDEDGVATPQIGLGFSVAQAPDIRAGGGQDEVRYNVNAPVSIDGGAGFDKIVILGTEFADDIVIRADGIFGAGLNVRYSTVEVVEVDGLEGDDEFFVLSTAFGVSYRVIGGLGSDVINVGGDVTEDIVTRELEGATGTVDHLVRSGDALYDGVVIDGFDYNVARDGEGLVVINEEAAGDTSPGRTVVGERDTIGAQFEDTYTVRLAEALTGSQVVYVTVSAARSPQEEQDDYPLNAAPLPNGQGESIWLSLDGLSGAHTNNYGGLATTADDGFMRLIQVNGQDVWVSQNAVTIAFSADGLTPGTFKWDSEVSVNVFAPDDFRAEGDRVTVIQHSVVSNVAKYDGIDVRNVEVEVRDNDTPGVRVREMDVTTPGVEDGRTIVVEGDDTTKLTDEIRLSLAKQPAGTVVVDLVVDIDSNNALEFFEISDPLNRLTLFAETSVRADGMVVIGQITFDGTNWDDEISVGIQARDDYVREDLETAVLEFEYNVAESGDKDYTFPNERSGFQLLDVEVYDNETSGAVVLESAGDTVLVPEALGKDDDYQIRLTRQPDDSVTVAVLTDGLADVTAINGITISPEDYADVGGLLATQMFNGNVVFGTDGGVLTLTRGEGSDLGSFHDDGFFGESLEPTVRFDGSLTFATSGGNLAINGTGVGAGFSNGETLRVRAGSVNGFDLNNDDYTVLSVSANQIVLAQTGTWAKAGAEDDVQLSDFAVVPGQRVRVGGSLVAPFEDVVTFGNDGVNLTLTRAVGSFVDDGYLADQSLVVIADDDNGFEVNNGTYTILSVSAGTITLTAAGTWAQAGASVEEVALAVSNDGDFVVESVSENGKVITLAGAAPLWMEGATLDPLVLSDLAENTFFEGTVSFGEETDPQSFPGQFIDTGVTGAQEGWLADGFLEGQWVRVYDLSGVNETIEAKVQLIRGDNDSKDAKLQLIHVTINGVESTLDATWLGDGTADNVRVVRIAAEVSFTDANWYDLQEVTLSSDDDYIIPPTRDGVKIFPVSTHLLSKLRGPLAVEGGPAGADRSLTAGVKLPGEKDDFLIAIGAQPPESQQIDVLNIFNDSSQADTSGIMDQTTLRGFGMAKDLTFEGLSGPLFGEGDEGSSSITVPGGISFGKVNYGSSSVGTDGTQSTIEVVNLLLGAGNDYLDIVGTLDPAPFVSAQNEFDLYLPGADPDSEDLFDAFYTVRSDDIDWKAEGFLPGQTVFVEGISGIQFEVVEVADAVYLDGDGLPVDDGLGGILRDPNDNSILVLRAVDGQGQPAVLSSAQQQALTSAFTAEVRLIAIDALVIGNFNYTVQSTPTGAVLAGIDWEAEGFLEGHLINIGGEDGSFDEAVQYRVLSIDGTVMEILGEPIAAGSYTANIWVQGPHGSLTTVHGGGNLAVETLGDYTVDTIDGDNTLLRQDGRNWAEDGFEVGQIIQVGAEGETRTVLGIANASAYGYDSPDFAAATWGTGSILILSGDPFAAGDLLATDVHKSIATRVEVTTTVTLLADKLTNLGGNWDDFEAGQVIYIEGIPGGFTIESVEANVITLAGAAIHKCVIEPGSEITVYRIDVTQDAGQGGHVGGDHFVVGLQFDLTAFGIDTSDGIDAQELAVLGGLNIAGVDLQDGVDNAELSILSGQFNLQGIGVDPSDGLDAGEQAIVDLVKANIDMNSVLAGWNSPLVVYGDTSQDGVWYSGHSYDRLGLEFGPKPFNPFPDLPDEENEDDEWVFPLANSYDYAGDDVIDASALFLLRPAPTGILNVGFTAYGGAGNDLIVGSQAGDHLAGGSGDDTILGMAGTDHIYGDSGVNVNILTRAVDIATSDRSPAPTVDRFQGASDQTFKPVRAATPMRDDMVAGQDVIDGNGGSLADTPNIIFGDHGEILMFVDDPNLPPNLAQRIQTTSLDLVLAINSKEFQNGGDDVIFGDDQPDVLIGGAGNDMLDGRTNDDLIFGDNVFLTNRGDDITSLRFQALAGIMLYSRTDRNTPTYMGAGTSAATTPEFPYTTSGTASLGEDNSGRLLTNGIAQNYRDPTGADWWASYNIDYALFHNFAVEYGLAGVGSFGNDYIAGGAGNDQIFGQMGHDWIQGDGSIDDAVANIAHVGAARVPGIDGIIHDPTGPLTVVPSFEALTDGQDYIEGGGGRDVIFGGLGQDDIVGGSSDFFGLGIRDDLKTGVDGSESLLVQLGLTQQQQDMVLNNGSFLRPDSDDWLFGGAGTQIDRNNGFDPELGNDGTAQQYGGDVVTALGVAYADKHGRDSDAIVGDNGDIIRIVGTNGIDVNPQGDLSSPQYVEFNYDSYGGEKIVVRGVRLIDYTPGGPDAAPDKFFEEQPGAYLMWGECCDPETGFWSMDIGGHDEVHGETGDDFIYVGGGFDRVFGDADNDDIIGGWGHDWISGGTGIDGILGDDGRIFTSRNTSAQRAGEFGQNETLYGIDYLLNSDPDTRTSQGNVLSELIRTPGNVQVELINVAGDLKKSVDLTPFALDDAFIIDDPLATNPVFADDVIFGGLGVDFLHGGDGDDAISGAEALESGYAPRFDAQGNFVGLYKSDFNSPYNPSDILRFGDDTDPWNDPKPIQQRLGEFFLYDEYDPRRVILFDVSDPNIVWKGDAYDPADPFNTGGLLQYFLNNTNDEGVSELGYVAFKNDGRTPDYSVAMEYRQSDGDDVIFGDLGNDWLVGGTGRDRIYGGFGNDLMNADDVLGTIDPNGPIGNRGQLPLDTTDQSPDTHWTYEDRVFGGAGLDILIGNTKGDRLIDWVGEFNSYLVPFAPFGIATVSRQVPPHLFDFLYAQAYSDGADITRTADGNLPNHNDRYSNVALLQGGIRGEIGLVTQKDHGYWQDQTGGPSDPQAGNVPGGRRDVLRTSDFNNNSGDIFIRDTGNMTVQGGQMTLAASSNTSQSSAVYNLDEYLPIYYEVTAQISSAKPTGGAKSNAFIIFDYQSDIDFKYAGINISNNKIEMGYRDATGYHELIQSNKPVRIKPNTFYSVLLAVNGNNVTLAIDGVNWFSYDYAPVLDEEGLPIPLNKGFVGFSVDGGVATVDNFTVQILPPDWTIEVEDDFSTPDAANIFTPQSGDWSVQGGSYAADLNGADVAISLVDLARTPAYSSIIEMEATVAAGNAGGIVFDYYDDTRFKFVILDASTDQIMVGHHEESGLYIDQTFVKSLQDNKDHDLKFTTSGAALTIMVNGATVGGHSFNSVLVDGAFGLIGFGDTEFKEFVIRNNDPAFNEPEALHATSIGSNGSANLVTAQDIDALKDVAIDALVEELGLNAQEAAMLRSTNISIRDLDGTLLGETDESGIVIDLDAAGHGWFVDLTPLSNEEYTADVNGVLRALSTEVAAGRVDLLSVLTHEFNHMLNSPHLASAQDGSLYSAELSAGTRLSMFGDEPAEAGSGQVLIYDDMLGGFVTDEGLRHSTSGRTLDLDLNSDGDGLVQVESSDAPPVDTSTQSEPVKGKGKGANADQGETVDETVIAWSENNGLLKRLGSLFKK